MKSYGCFLCSHIAATKMKLLAPLWSLMLITLIKVSVQQCVLEDINVLELVLSTEVNTETYSSTTYNISAIYYNCLSASQSIGLYSSTSMSVLYNKSGSDTLKEVRYNLWCMREHWVRVGRTATALRSNDTRTDCYSCINQGVNENHCSGEFYEINTSVICIKLYSCNLF